MKKIIVVLLAGITLVSCANNDKKVEGPVLTPEEKKQAIEKMDSIAKDPTQFTDIKWLDSTYLDLGEIKEGKMVEVAFRFKNTGTKPLVISSVTAGCGCTVPEKPEKPYLPGEEGVIKATFDSKDRVGEARKPIYVVANTNSGTTQELTFRVLVKK